MIEWQISNRVEFGKVLKPYATRLITLSHPLPQTTYIYANDDVTQKFALAKIVWENDPVYYISKTFFELALARAD